MAAPVKCLFWYSFYQKRNHWPFCEQICLVFPIDIAATFDRSGNRQGNLIRNRCVVFPGHRCHCGNAVLPAACSAANNKVGVAVVNNMTATSNTAIFWYKVFILILPSFLICWPAFSRCLMIDSSFWHFLYSTKPHMHHLIPAQWLLMVYNTSILS